MNRLLLVVLVSVTSVSSATAEVTFSIDLDPDTPGIQAQRTVALNQPFDAYLVLTIAEDTSISGYSTTVRFDASNFSVISIESPRSLPAGWFGIGIPEVRSPIEASDVRFPGDVGQIELLSAGVFGDSGLLGSGFSAAVAKITLLAESLTDGESLSLLPGFFNEGIDGIESDPEVPAQRISFHGATITAVPEPGSMAGLALLVIGGVVAHRRRVVAGRPGRTAANS